ncbi:uncharacterized protein LOC143261223 [Megalopta genalis]|uniref:uncharacterized protein LOC143261223 n=1 Tax=Megalopta genalis TaxID=115081 RepID=UPI003FD0FBE8
MDNITNKMENIILNNTVTAAEAASAATTNAAAEAASAATTNAAAEATSATTTCNAAAETSSATTATAAAENAAESLDSILARQREIAAAYESGRASQWRNILGQLARGTARPNLANLVAVNRELKKL